ncbi:S8 family peptidase [Nonomuraea insulae]|uniref:S8 family serine peptidase n=1 Tax=Nonomuraea insulae TaxID=1616787 RepID=A0ABW1DAA1_9ACTN
MRVLIQLRLSPDIVNAVADPAVITTAADVAGRLAGPLPGVVIDESFAPLTLVLPQPASPRGDPLSLNQPLSFSTAPQDTHVLIRGEIDADDVTSHARLLRSTVREVTGVFADPSVEHHLTCAGSGAVGDWHDVRRLLHTSELWQAGCDGDGVMLAVADGGFNYEHIKAHLGAELKVDATRSWSPPGAPHTPGRYEVAHGTMCAFDALLAAPKATLLDIAVIQSRTPGGPGNTAGFLSDAVAAYAHLHLQLTTMPAESRKLVISNSWGVYNSDQDFPVGHPGNYSDNPSHPFNTMVASLENAGADIVFSAGNCGRQCAAPNCNLGERSIAGANGHPKVLTVGGVDTHDERVGYSSEGPGRLTDHKPDICAYTHFTGSQFDGPTVPDNGTSAACPVAAGVVAAIRARWSVLELPPGRLRSLLQATAQDRSTQGFDYDYGYGIINPLAVVAALDEQARRAA